MEDEDDVHMCLVCSKTIQGLLNYINHKKNECVGKKSQKKPETTTFMPRSASSTTAESLLPSSAQSYNSESFFIESSYNSEQPPGLASASLLTDQGTFLHTDSLHSSNGNFPSSGFPDVLATCQNSQTDGDLHISLPSYTNNPTTDSTQMTYSLSPIFSTSLNTAVEKSSMVSGLDNSLADPEDHGIMSAVIIKSTAGHKKQQKNKHLLSTNYETVTHYDESEASNFITKKEEGAGKEEVIDDFFQSLELMSKTDPRAEKIPTLNQLPISNILNNLTFSSDEEDLSFSFAEDVSFDSLTDDSGAEMAPPRHHTGGKWKPGEKPAAYRKNRHQYHGKWPPGQGPVQAKRRHGPSPRGKDMKLIQGLEGLNKSKTKVRSSRKRKKVSATSSCKVLSCSFCNLTFDNRFKYSNHCRSTAHKANVFGSTGSTLCDEKHKTDEGNKIVEIVNEDNLTENGNNKDNRVVEEGSLIDQEREAKPAVEKDSQLDNNEETEDDVGKETDDGDSDMESTVSAVHEKSVEQEDNSVDGTKDPEKNENAIPVKTVHICTVCDKKFPNKFMISKHLLTKFHKNRAAARPKEHFMMLQQYNKSVMKFSPYQCSICRYYYNSYADFKNHVKSESHENNCKDLTGEMKCTLCKFKTHEHDAMLRHFDSQDHITAIGNINKICILKECHVSSTCKYCGLEMKSYSRLMRHVKLKHSDGKKVFGVKKVVRGIRNQPTCPKCSKQCVSESALKLHIIRFHTQLKKYKCEVCNKSFVDKYTLQRHCKSASHSNWLDAFTVPTDQNKIKDSRDLETNQSSESAAQKKDDSEEEAKMFLSAVSTETNAALNLGDHYGSETDDQLENGLDKVPEPVNERPRSIFKIKPYKRISGSRMKKTTFKCDHCDFTVAQYDDLRPHYLEKHSAQIRTCEPCDMTFLSEKALKLHWNSLGHQKAIGAGAAGIDIKLFECHICKKKYSDENYRNFHTAYQHLHATNDSEAIKANGGKSITYEKYSTLLKSVESYDLGHKVQCPDCDSVVKKANLIVHLRTHTNERLFHCKICSKSFIASYTLRKHVLQHFGCTERTCDVCGKDFRKVSAFQKHMRVHKAEQTNNGKTFICETCGMDFYLESQLKRHVIRHTEKKFKCTFPGCHWKFVQRGELNAHARRHEEVKKYLCDLCGYAAHTPYHLRRHNKVHTGERKFHCEYCTYKAGNNTHLQRHMRIHIGSKPFKCPYCSYACNTHENIRKHILETKKHTGKKMYPCKFCSYGTNSSKDFRIHLEKEHEDMLGKDFREPALTAFTGVYDRNLDPKQPLEGMKIIHLKERKATRRKKCEDDLLSDNETKASVEVQPPNKRKSRKSLKKEIPNITISAQHDFTTISHEGLDHIAETDTGCDQSNTPLSLIVNKHTKAYVISSQVYLTERSNQIPQNFGQIQDPGVVYQGQSYYHANANVMEPYVAEDSKQPNDVVLPFNS